MARSRPSRNVGGISSRFRESQMSWLVVVYETWARGSGAVATVKCEASNLAGTALASIEIDDSRHEFTGRKHQGLMKSGTYEGGREVRTRRCGRSPGACSLRRLVRVSP